MLRPEPADRHERGPVRVPPRVGLADQGRVRHEHRGHVGARDDGHATRRPEGLPGGDDSLHRLGGAKVEDRLTVGRLGQLPDLEDGHGHRRAVRGADVRRRRHPPRPPHRPGRRRVAGVGLGIGLVREDRREHGDARRRDLHVQEAVSGAERVALHRLHDRRPEALIEPPAVGDEPVGQPGRVPDHGPVPVPPRRRELRRHLREQVVARVGLPHRVEAHRVDPRLLHPRPQHVIPVVAEHVVDRGLVLLTVAVVLGPRDGAWGKGRDDRHDGAPTGDGTLSRLRPRRWQTPGTSRAPAARQGSAPRRGCPWALRSCRRGRSARPSTAAPPSGAR